MNKNLLKICFVAAVLISASSAYAATTISSTTVMGGGTFSPSKNVSIFCKSGGSNYSAVAKHSSGDRVVGFNNRDPKMYYNAIGVTVSATAPTNDTDEYNTWTSL